MLLSKQHALISRKPRRLAEFDDAIANEVHEVSDEELMADTTSNVGKGIQEMLTSLTRLRETTDEVEASAPKKPRTEEPGGGQDGGSTALPKALQPFAKGDK